MDITECSVTPEGKTEYRCLYRYKITQNEYIDGRFSIKGRFEKVNTRSEHLQTMLTRSGVPQEMLERFMRKESNT